VNPFNELLHRKKIPILIIFLFRVTAAFACNLPGHFEFDVSNDEEILYSGCYDAINLGPHIITYILTKERLIGDRAERPSAQFTQDRDGGILQNKLTEYGYSLPWHGDYYYSGYDRGHMAPNADFNDSYENALATFFIANIWPQTPHVNRSSWLITENETRRLAWEYSIIWVTIIVDEFSDEMVEDIQVPSCFKKRVYDLNTGNLIYEIDVFQWDEEE